MHCRYCRSSFHRLSRDRVAFLETQLTCGVMAVRAFRHDSHFEPQFSKKLRQITDEFRVRILDQRSVRLSFFLIVI
jgi:hypothetical protein